jgi:hypothetical protein
MKVAANTTASTADVTGELAELASLKPGMGYETNYNYLMANQCREEYARTYAIRDSLLAAHVSGFLDITVRSGAGVVTIPFIGSGATGRAQNLFVELAELLGDKLTKLENDIVRYERDSLKEEAGEREGTGSRAQTFSFCLPMRPMSDADFQALPAEAQRAFDEYRAENMNQSVKGGQAA